jgi:hypothetical protein
MLAPAPPVEEVFAYADVLYALEWASLAPGLGGWTVLLDDDHETREILVIPPGMEQPAFCIYRSGRDVLLSWLRPTDPQRPEFEVARVASLREAVLLLCPLSEESIAAVHDSMEVMYPRSLRIH